MAGRSRVMRLKTSIVNNIDAHTFSGPMKSGTSPSIGVTRNYWYNYATQCNQNPNQVKKSYANMVFLNINPAQTPVSAGFRPTTNYNYSYIGPKGVETGPTENTGPTGATGASNPNATSINITDIGITGTTYYPTFVDGSGNRPLYINSTNTLAYKNGNLGIGTTTPVYTLDVSGDINTNTQYSVSGIPITKSYLPSLETTSVNNVVSNWTSRNSPIPESSFNRCAWSPQLNLFATIGQQGLTGRIITSPDGINWTKRDSGFTINNVSQVNLTNCNNGVGNIITCADTSRLMVNTTINVTNTPIVTSIIDASSFETNNLIPSLSNTAFSTYGYTCNDTSGMLVGMSVSKIAGVGSSSGRQITHVDTLTTTKFVLTAIRNWNGNTCHVDRAGFGMAWCSDLSGTGYFIGSYTSSSTQQIITSSDGINWIARNTPVGFDGLYDIGYSPTLKRVVVAAQLSGFIYSNDGINWIGVANPVAGVSIGYVTWVGSLNLFVAACFGSNTIHTSPDGINWTSTTPSSLPSLNYQGIVYSESLELFVMVTFSGNKNVYISRNLIDWEGYATPDLSFSPRVITWTPELGIFVVAGQTGANRISYSYDGKTWFMRTAGLSGYRGIAYSPSLRLFAISAGSDRDSVAYSNTASYNIFLGSSTNLPTTIDLSGNTNILGNLAVDTNTFFVDASNNRVGILRTNPSITLDVSGGSIGNSGGDLTLNVNSTGAGGALRLAGGTGLLSATAGVNSGQHLVLTINGTPYKIVLLNV